MSFFKFDIFKKLWYNYSSKKIGVDKMAHIVTCRICGQKFDAEKEQYIKPKERQYYHKSCYDKLQFQVHNMDITKYDSAGLDEMKITYHYLAEDVKLVIDFQRFKRQWDSLVKKEYTPKGIHWALKYFYGIQKGDPEKAKNGIGIVEYIYKEAAKFWESKLLKEMGVRESLKNIPIIVKTPESKHNLSSPKKRIGPKFNLASLNNLEELDD